MSSLIDEGHWIYGAVVVVLLSMLLQFSINSRIYEGYEAVYREIETAEPEIEARVPTPPEAATSNETGVRQEENDQFADNEFSYPDFVVDRRPLPLVGNVGWWFVSFAPAGFLSTVMGLALLYVPCLILLVTLAESLGSFSVVLRRDYGPLLTCSLMAWAAAHLPFALAGLALAHLSLGASSALALWSLSACCFGILMAVAIRTLFGFSFGKSLGITCLAALSFAVQAKLFAAISPYLFSPFLLYYGYYMFRNDLGDIGFSLRQRQNFRRSMEAATINPRNAEAHYQLGLIFQHRRQYNEAIARFKRAIQIDAGETDAYYQLGRVARLQNRLQEALDHFGVVIEQDVKHSHCEVWREIGQTYLAASMCSEAKDAFHRFVESRPYDPEGLYSYGRVLEQLGESTQARECFERCVEAVHTMPYYRRGQLRQWHKLARARLAARPQAG